MKRDEDERGPRDPGPAGETRTVRTWVYDREGARAEVLQEVAGERPVTLYLNGRELVTLLCLGHRLDELAVGFLRGEGFLRNRADLVGVEVDAGAGAVRVSTAGEPKLASRLWEKRTITSGCGKGSVFHYALDALMARPVEGGVQIAPAQVLERVTDLNRSSVDLRRTHGVHTAGLAAPDRMLVVREDIGRHNAVDMIAGHCLLGEVALDDKLLVTTGRLTSEIVIKCAKLGLSALVSVHAATALAVDLARSLGITLVGYARRGRFTVYSGDDRIRP